VRIVLNIVGITLALFGILWILQGASILNPGFMAGQTKWAIVGILVLLAASVILRSANRKKN
jgi:FtsH-binding integral membrane protein